MKNILTLHKASKSFGDTQVLKDISFDIEKGKIISLLGKSGSGKTTLLNIIAGFEKSDSGDMCIKNKIIFDPKTFVEPQKRNIGFVFQNYALFPHMDIFENITFGIDKYKKEEKQKIVDGLLKLIEMEGYEKRYPHELSGGQQQRIALVRAMALNPELILLDEPFSSIDTMMKSSIQKQLLKILKGSHKTAIIVTHDPYEAMALSDKIIYLENGEVVQYASPDEIYQKPKNKNVATSFGTASFLTYEKELYCVRPEHCKVVQSGGLHGVVESQTFQGKGYQVEVKIKDEQLIFFSSSYIEQEFINIEIDWKKCWGLGV